MRGGYYIRDVPNFLVDRPRGLIPIKLAPSQRNIVILSWDPEEKSAK
jgi:hypothetical protein